MKNILCFLAWIGPCFYLFVFSALAAIKKLGGAALSPAQTLETIKD